MYYMCICVCEGVSKDLERAGIDFSRGCVFAERQVRDPDLWGENTFAREFVWVVCIDPGVNPNL